MNVTKRTWILLGVAILAILAAFASLYFEKEEEIKTLENIEPEPEKEKTARSTIKSRVKETISPEIVIVNSEENGNGTEQK
jgi:hypothetical protein